MSFEIGRLGVGGDFDVGWLGLRLAWFGGGLRGRLVGGLDQRVGSWENKNENILVSI